jgi:TolA-binding protein
MTALACPDSLIARSRTGQLSSVERSQLHLHLQRCEACRVSLLVGRDFDAALAAQSDDTLFVSQVVRAVRSSSAGGAQLSRARPSRSRRRVLMYGLAAALLTSSFVVGAASPALRRTIGVFFGLQSISAPPASRGVVRSVSKAAKVKPLASQAESTLSVPRESAPSETHALPQRAEVSTTTESTPARDALSVKTLFAQANARRRSGDLAGATKLYQELQQRYPQSREAEVSRVTVGRLLLERSGDANLALQQFDRALRNAGADRAGLDEEALFGRASALMRLGHPQDERRAWEQLIQQYPDSIYAARARTRLAELVTAGHGDGLGIFPAQQ